jgi:hypothetical protein
MYYATIKDAKVDKFGKLEEIFPNVAFPLSGPNNDFIKENGLEEVIQYLEHDETKQHIVYCDPYIKDAKVYCVELVDMTKEEIAARKAALKDFDKMTAGFKDAK